MADARPRIDPAAASGRQVERRACGCFRLWVSSRGARTADQSGSRPPQSQRVSVAIGTFNAMPPVSTDDELEDQPAAGERVLARLLDNITRRGSSARQFVAHFRDPAGHAELGPAGPVRRKKCRRQVRGVSAAQPARTITLRRVAERLQQRRGPVRTSRRRGSDHRRRPHLSDGVRQAPTGDVKSQAL